MREGTVGWRNGQAAVEVDRSISRDRLDGADMAIDQSPLILAQKNGVAHADINGTNLADIEAPGPG